MGREILGGVEHVCRLYQLVAGSEYTRSSVEEGALMTRGLDWTLRGWEACGAQARHVPQVGCKHTLYKQQRVPLPRRAENGESPVILLPASRRPKLKLQNVSLRLHSRLSLLPPDGTTRSIPHPQRRAGCGRRTLLHQTRSRMLTTARGRNHARAD